MPLLDKNSPLKRILEQWIWLSWLVGAVVLPILPMFAHQSQHIVVPVFSFMLFLGVWVGAGLSPILHRGASIAQNWLFLALAAFLFFAMLSTLWSSIGHRTFGIALSLLGIGFTAFLLEICRPYVCRNYTLTMMAVGFGMAYILYFIELRSGLALRSLFGLKLESYLLNRGLVSLCLMTLPLLAYFYLSGRMGLLFVLGGFALLVVFQSQSASAQMGLVLGLICLFLAKFIPKTLFIMGLVGFFIIVVGAPYIYQILPSLFSEALLKGLEDAHAGERLGIWHAFSVALFASSPIGFGLENSWIALNLPTATALSLQDFKYIGFGHPHNFTLQLWYELGFVGVGLFCTVLYFLYYYLWQIRNEPHVLVLFCSSLASVGSVMLVSHGAWQPWWISTIVMVVFINICVFQKLKEESSHV